MPDPKMARHDHGKVKVTVRLPTDVLAEATRMARKRGVYVDDVIAEAIMRDAFFFDEEEGGKSVLLADKKGGLFKVNMKRSRGTRRDQPAAAAKRGAPPARGRGAVIEVDFSRREDDGK